MTHLTKRALSHCHTVQRGSAVNKEFLKDVLYHLTLYVLKLIAERSQKTSFLELHNAVSNNLIAELKDGKRKGWDTLSCREMLE